METEKGGHMIWLFAALAICSGIVIAGRAHSKYLDEMDERWRPEPNHEQAEEFHGQLCPDRDR